MLTRIFEDLAYLYPLWRDVCLGIQGSESKEANFVLDVFKTVQSSVKSVIDLGGGVGTHSKILVKNDLDVTLLDRSRPALDIVNKSYPDIKTIESSFESIDAPEKFDAGICMWSTLSYVSTPEGRKVFYGWLKDHINKIIILDQANFYRYSNIFSKIYEGENDKYKLKILREWTLNDSNLKSTTYKYEIYNKETGETEHIDDAEDEQYLTVDELQTYLGSEWKLKQVVGGYGLAEEYKQESSLRLITIFERNV